MLFQPTAGAVVSFNPRAESGGLGPALVERLPHLGRQLSRLAGAEDALNRLQDGRRRRPLVGTARTSSFGSWHTTK